MNTVIGQIKRFLAVFSALFITLISTKVRASHHHTTCGSEELAQCAAPLSVLTDSGLTFVSSKDDLDRICPELKEAVRCIHSYTRLCMNLDHRKHFKMLFHGTASMVRHLCNNGTYQEEYLKYAPCMREVAPQNNICFTRFSTEMKQIQEKSETQNNFSNPTELITYQKRKREAADEGIRSVCCSFQEYVACSTHTMRRHCGEDAAEFSREFLQRMSESLLQTHCTEFGARECRIFSSSSKISISTVGLALLSVLALLI